MARWWTHCAPRQVLRLGRAGATIVRGQASGLGVAWEWLGIRGHCCQPGTHLQGVAAHTLALEPASHWCACGAQGWNIQGLLVQSIFVTREGTPAGTIIGAVIGAVVGLAVLALAGWGIMRWRRRRWAMQLPAPLMLGAVADNNAPPYGGG